MTEDARVKTIDSVGEFFTRTGIVLDIEGNSFDLVDHDGKPIIRINTFSYDNNHHLIVDVIALDEAFNKNTAITLQNGVRDSIPAAKVISADFKKGH